MSAVMKNCPAAATKQPVMANGFCYLAATKLPTRFRVVDPTHPCYLGPVISAASRGWVPLKSAWRCYALRA